MSFLAPAYLIGLLGLAIPILIHLWSKQSNKKIPFGSTRFLKETETKSMRSLMPSQWWLLLTRMLLLTLLVLILAETHYYRSTENVDTMLLLDRSYEGQEWLSTIQDTISDHTELVWLANGFPDIVNPAPSKSNSYWQLLSNPPKSATNYIVVSPLLARDFYGQSSSFPVPYTWLKLPVNPKKTRLVSYSADNEPITIETNFDEWSISHQVVDIQGEIDPLQVSYSFVVDDQYKDHERIFTAAFSTLNTVSPLSLNEMEQGEEVDWVIWLSDLQPPSQEGLIVIDTTMVSHWNELIPGIIRISSSLTEEEAIRINVPQKLLDAFSYRLRPEFGQDHNLLTMDIQNFYYSKPDETRAALIELKSGASILWVLFLFTLVLERWLSFKSEKS